MIKVAASIATEKATSGRRIGILDLDAVLQGKRGPGIDKLSVLSQGGCIHRD